jgi:four helix bundle protein
MEGMYPLPEISAHLVCEGQDQYANLKRRTKQYALRIFKLARSLPSDPVAEVLQKQVIRAGGSVAANYRAACRAKSTADFIHKMGIVEEEADETLLWMELAVEDGLIPESRVQDLHAEGNEILSIVIQSIRTAKLGKK